MSKRTVNPNAAKRLILIAVGIIVVILICQFLLSCNPALKIDRDNQKAVNRVNANVNLQVPVVNAWLNAHPQRKDTIKEYIPGPQIKVNIPVPVRDTARERFLKDSLLAVEKDCKAAAESAFDLGYEQAGKYYESHPIFVKCPDSHVEKTVDHSAIDRLNDSLIHKNRQISGLEGQIIEKDKNAKAQTKLATTRLYWAIGFGILAFVLLVLYIIKIIKGLPTSILKR